MLTYKILNIPPGYYDAPTGQWGPNIKKVISLMGINCFRANLPFNSIDTVRVANFAQGMCVELPNKTLQLNSVILDFCWNYPLSAQYLNICAAPAGYVVDQYASRPPQQWIQEAAQIGAEFMQQLSAALVKLGGSSKQILPKLPNEPRQVQQGSNGLDAVVGTYDNFWQLDDRGLECIQWSYTYMREYAPGYYLGSMTHHGSEDTLDDMIGFVSAKVEQFPAVAQHDWTGINCYDPWSSVPNETVSAFALRASTSLQTHVEGAVAAWPGKPVIIVENDVNPAAIVPWNATDAGNKAAALWKTNIENPHVLGVSLYGGWGTAVKTIGNLNLDGMTYTVPGSNTDELTDKGTAFAAAMGG